MVLRARIRVALLLVTLALSSAGAQDRPKIYFGASSKTLGYGPLWAAVKKGFLEQQGLDGQLITKVVLRTGCFSWPLFVCSDPVCI